MNMDYAIEHVQIDSADHPADPNQDDQFIPHEEQVWELDQHEQSEHPEQQDIWIQQGCNHYNYRQGQWWKIARFDWVTPGKGRSYWTPATWTKVSLDEISSHSRVE